jgi:uncharacterized protein
MQCNVAQLLKQPTGTTRTYRFDERLEPVDGLPRRAVVSVLLTRTNRGILAQRTARVEVHCQCSRCLEEFDTQLEFNFEEEYLPTRDIATGAFLPAPEDDSAFLIDENHILDFTEAVRQYTVINTPIRVLCRPDCAGLCPTCGKNLNFGGCDCPPEPADPRLAALASLLDRLSTA